MKREITGTKKNWTTKERDFTEMDRLKISVEFRVDCIVEENSEGTGVGLTSVSEGIKIQESWNVYVRSRLNLVKWCYIGIHTNI